MSEKTTTIISGLHKVIDDYDGFLIDVYGVIHDGTKLYPHVIHCLEKLSEHEKAIALISNTAMRSRDLTQKLNRLGISAALFQHVFTAGEAAFQHLLKRDDPWYSKLGECCYYLGPSHSRLLEDLKMRKTEDIEKADFILLTGSDDWHQQLSDYKETLLKAIERDIPMVCASPNISEDSSSSHLDAGSIEQFYEENGGRVRVHGKTNPHFFSYAVKALGVERILMVGDSLHFDIQGAHSVGLDGAFVACGIHAGRLCDIDENVADLFKVEPYYDQFDVVPRYTLSQLKW